MDGGMRLEMMELSAEARGIAQLNGRADIQVLIKGKQLNSTHAQRSTADIV